MKLKTGIEIWMGLPGAGKSTMAAWLAYKHLKNGYVVYSNFPIDGCRILDLKKDIMKYNMENALILIDEAGLEYDSRDWKAFSKSSTEFYKTHRHYRLRICLFTQWWDDVDKKIRMITNKIYVVRKSLIPFFVKTKEIIGFVGISDQKDIVMQYDYKSFFLGGTRYYFILNARKLFDSWSHPELPSKAWDHWVVNKKIDSNKKSFFYTIRDNLILKKK
jgi:zona occludens toxin (predicted ATPase)